MSRSAILSHRLDARVGPATGGASVGGARVGASDSDNGTVIIVLGVIGLGLIVAGMSPRKGW